MKPDLSVEIAGLKLKNPVMTASGTFGYGLEYEPFFDISLLGAVVVKGLSLKPKAGNPPPRVVETPAGMLNAIGLQNVGVDRFLTEKLPGLREKDVPVIVNFFGNTVEEYIQVAERLDGVDGIAALEANISCPNVKAGGIAFGTDASVANGLIGKIRKATSLPLIVKLSPNVTDVKKMARAVEDAGADALSMINTITGMSIDIRTRRSKLANMTGGLSGPAIRPVAVRMVWETAKVAGIPIIGVGGIVTAEDAIEFIMAGASAVQIGTANFISPTAALDVVKGIERFMLDEGVEKFTDLIGAIVE
jgi:dihydroorotate dehydrogenase (NAD+) catalytic subunit